MKVLMMAAAVLIASASAAAAEEKNAFSELDAKITKNLSSKNWNEASKAFVRAMWTDYKNAHINAATDGVTRSIQGKMPDVQSADDYVGDYSRGRDGHRTFMSISKSEDGRFFVEADRHRIPAVVRNRCVIFTTGDVVYSSIPAFGDKPYCSLEMLMVVGTGGKLYFASPGTPPDKWREVSKRDVKKPVSDKASAK
jgi:hypothetical protein